MAAEKKPVKPVVNPKAEASKVEKAVETAVKKVETPVAEVKAEVTADVKKAVEKKAPAKKATEKKATEKKATAKKAPAKKAPAKKVEMKSELHVEFSGKSYTQEDLVKIAKDVWKYDLKQKVSDLASIKLYIKPEENVAYYVMNDAFTGSFGI